MKFVGAALCNHIDISALSKPKLGARVRAVEPKLGNPILGKILARFALLLPVVADPVNGESIRVKVDTSADVDAVVKLSPDGVLARSRREEG